MQTCIQSSNLKVCHAIIRRIPGKGNEVQLYVSVQLGALFTLKWVKVPQLYSRRFASQLKWRRCGVFEAAYETVYAISLRIPVPLIKFANNGTN